MTDLRTARLLLRPVDVAEARRIVDRSAGPEDSWAADFPFDGDIGAVGALLRATAEHGDQRPFGYYRITRLADGAAIGGIGFKGALPAGRADIGYGLAPSGRGCGYAAEAVLAVLDLARGHGLRAVTADTTPDNVASQRTLLRAGFRLIATDPDLHHYEAVLDGQTG